MNASRFVLSASLFTLGSLLVSTAQGQAPTKDLLGLNDDVGKRLTLNGGLPDEVNVVPSQDSAAPGLVITIQPGKADCPGVNLKPPGGKTWDLSAFGHVEARVVNTGSKAARFALRVDNEGDWRDAPWNTEHIDLKPGERRTITVIFGHQYNHQPGFPLDPKKVVNILRMTDKVSAPTSFRIESLAAGGPAGEKPPVDPASIRIRPDRGVLLGAGVQLDAKTQIETKAVKVAVGPDGQSVSVVFPAVKGEQWLAIKPPMGRWDLTLATEVLVKLKNAGATLVTPSVQVASHRGPTDTVAAAPLAAGEEKEIVVSFSPALPGRGEPFSRPASPGNQSRQYAFCSDAAGPVRMPTWTSPTRSISFQDCIPIRRAIGAIIQARRPPATKPTAASTASGTNARTWMHLWTCLSMVSIVPTTTRPWRLQAPSVGWPCGIPGFMTAVGIGCSTTRLPRTRRTLRASSPGAPAAPSAPASAARGSTAGRRMPRKPPG